MENKYLFIYNEMLKIDIRNKANSTNSLSTIYNLIDKKLIDSNKNLDIIPKSINNKVLSNNFNFCEMLYPCNINNYFNDMVNYNSTIQVYSLRLPENYLSVGQANSSFIDSNIQNTNSVNTENTCDLYIEKPDSEFTSDICNVDREHDHHNTNELVEHIKTRNYCSSGKARIKFFADQYNASFSKIVEGLRKKNITCYEIFKTFPSENGILLTKNHPLNLSMPNPNPDVYNLANKLKQIVYNINKESYRSFYIRKNNFEHLKQFTLCIQYEDIKSQLNEIEKSLLYDIININKTHYNA